MRGEPVLKRLRAFLASQTPALHSALATTVACELALAIVMTLHLPNPAWALVTVFVLSTPTAGSSLQKAVLRVIGTLVGAAIAVALIVCFDQAPVAFSLALFLVSVTAAYGATSRRHPYAYFIGLVTIVIVGFDSLTKPNITVYLAFARAAEVGVGVITAVLVRLSLWPQRASSKLRGELAHSLELSAPLLRGETAPDRDAAVIALIGSRQQQGQLLATAGGEGDLTRAQEERYTHSVAIVSAILRRVLAADAIASTAEPGTLLDARDGLATISNDLAQALRRESGRGGEALAARAGALGQVLRARAASGAASVVALARVLAALADELGVLAGIVDYLGPGASVAPPAVDAAARAIVEPTRRMWIDPARLLHAVKVALVIESALWLWMVFHLPSGMQGMVSALIIAQRTVGATLLKARLRLLGTICGGTIGILLASFAIPGVTSLGVFCLLTAPVLFASGWLNDGSPRWSYFGFQTGFAFILTLVAGSSPVPDALAPVLRLCGVLVGVVVVSMVMNTLAPVDAWSESLRGLAAMLTSIGRSLADGDRAAGVAERTVLRDDTLAYMGELAPEAARRGWSRRVFDQLLADESRLSALIVASPVSDTGGDDERELAQVAAHLAAAAGRLAVAIGSSQHVGDDGELAAAAAALRRTASAFGGSPTSADALAQRGVLQTMVPLLGAIENAVARAIPAPRGAATA
jgi:uncharacterized membrane protein YccC